MSEIQTKVIHYQAGLSRDGAVMVPVSYDELRSFPMGPLGDRNPTPEPPKATLSFPGLLVGGVLIFLALSVISGAGSSAQSGPSYEQLRAENLYLKQELAKYQGYIMGGQR